MGDNRPANPKINDVWLTDAGALEYYDGTQWLPYQSPPEWDLQPGYLEESPPDDEGPYETKGADNTEGPDETSGDS